ncbi:MAG: 23S rRNA (adenine(2503)-C(2))-methyltransferase RlmN [Victivallaceae bacterium]|nr:23S rRNA (adenine(2503)-C(2))-methyltransferase RlmN [Victivallaceae bacterium]
MKNRRHLLGIGMPELSSYLEAAGEPRFRAKQIAGWMYSKLVFRVADMTDLPAGLRDRMADDFLSPGSSVAERLESPDGTVKLRVLLHDGESVETVVIPSLNRVTLCISTQVGCPVGCRFCASGANGLVRNLCAGEILEQFCLGCEEAGRRVDNIVFMGIGEGLLNFQELSHALDVLSSPDGMAFAPRRITVSTSGYVPGMRRLAELKKEYNLAISLHAVDDRTRSSIIPDRVRYPINEILEAADAYRDAVNRFYTFEYTLISGVNDSLPEAKKLGEIAMLHHAKVNLIPVNPVNPEFSRPSQRAIRAFEQTVASTGAMVTVRSERGSGRDAACGQLRISARRRQ